LPDIEEIDIEQVKDDIVCLIGKYQERKIESGESGLKDISESNVRKDFIDPLFEALGWSVRDWHEYDYEHFVRDATKR
jgi:hypothetical protein